MADKIEDKLIKMKKTIDDAKQKSAQLQGALDQVKQRLQSEFNISSLEGAEALLDEMEMEISELEEAISKQIKKLESDYEWE